MQTICSNSVITFDVDDTLVMYEDIRNPGEGKIEFNYGDEKIYLRPHKFHITFLKHCFNRGDHVVIWSKNGWQWVEQVVDKLGLRNYVHTAMSKPSRHVDDKKDLVSIVGDGIFLPNK